MRNASVAIIGLNGMTTEIIKNLVLVGVGTLLLIDDQIVNESHLGSEFFLRNESIGNPVALYIRSIRGFQAGCRS